MPQTPSGESIRQEALTVLTSELTSQGHPPEYAQHMAAAVIFQTDLDLCSAQLSRLLAWLKDAHAELYPEALDLVEATRQEFENRINQD